MTPLDEFGLRRPGFRPGRVVVLADGQGWTLPFPVVKGFTRFPRIDADGRVTGLDNRRKFDDPAFDALIEDMLFSDGDEFELAVIMAGVMLLQENYDLTPKQAGRLFQRDIDDPEDEKMIGQIIFVAVGNAEAEEGKTAGPKVSPVGDGQACASTESEATSPPI